MFHPRLVSLEPSEYETVNRGDANTSQNKTFLNGFTIY